MPQIRFSKSALNEYIVRVVKGFGSSQAEAEMVAYHLVRADTCGHPSHGCGMLPTYKKHFDVDLLTPNAELSCVKDHGSILVYDGNRGFGQRMARIAMDKTIERAKQNGVAVMGLRNAHHIGRIGTYGEQAIENGMISIHFVNAVDHRPMVAAHRGAVPKFGTNPICIAMPGGNKHTPLLLDMATSRVALGKTRVAYNSGKKLPLGCVIDSEGKDTEEPSVMWEEPFGSLLPVGEHKGYGLMLFCELLAGTLSQGKTIAPKHKQYGSIINHMLTIVIDPQAMTDIGALKDEVDTIVEYVKDSKLRNPEEPVLVPGDYEWASAKEKEANGIFFDETSWKQITKVGDELGVGDVPTPLE